MTILSGKSATSPCSSRRGITLIETIVAAALLSVLLGAVGQFLSRWEAARRAAEERGLALRTLENVLERATVLARRHVSPTTLTLPAELKTRLNDPHLEILIGPGDDIDMSAVTASLSWSNAQGLRVAPVVLTAWLSLQDATEGDRP